MPEQARDFSRGLLTGFGNELDISPELFFVAFTMRGDKFSDGHGAYSVHEITPEKASKFWYSSRESNPEKTEFESAAYANSATGAWYVAHENRRQLHGLILQRISHFIAVFMIVLYHILMQICSEYKYDLQTINI